MRQLDLFQPIYHSSSDLCVRPKGPSLHFDRSVPSYKIQEILNLIGRGKLRVTDAAGNELKIKIS